MMPPCTPPPQVVVVPIDAKAAASIVAQAAQSVTRELLRHVIEFHKRVRGGEEPGPAVTDVLRRNVESLTAAPSDDESALRMLRDLVVTTPVTPIAALQGQGAFEWTFYDAFRLAVIRDSSLSDAPERIAATEDVVLAQMRALFIDMEGNCHLTCFRTVM